MPCSPAGVILLSSVTHDWWSESGFSLCAALLTEFQATHLAGTKLQSDNLFKERCWKNITHGQKIQTESSYTIKN